MRRDEHINMLEEIDNHVADDPQQFTPTSCTGWPRWKNRFDTILLTYLHERNDHNNQTNHNHHTNHNHSTQGDNPGSKLRH